MKFSLPITAIALTILSGCGGGNNSSPAPLPGLYPALTVWTNLITNGYNVNGNVTGTLTTTSGTVYPVTGSITVSVPPATSDTFEGQTALVNNGTITGSEIVTDSATSSSTTYPLNTTMQLYYSSAGYAPAGLKLTTSGIYDESYYEVINGTVALPPSTVNVGNTAVIANFDRYTDSSKTTYLGKSKLGYAVVADTTTTTNVILQFTRDDYDAVGSRLSTETISWSIDTSGNATFVSDVVSKRIQSGAWQGDLLKTTITP